jgi:hypothetical protein
MYKQPQKGFRGFIWEPSTEQEVVILFGRLLNESDFAVAVDRARTPFPDCIAVDTVGDVATNSVNIEFEYRSTSFWSHRSEWAQLAAADRSARWEVVCWHNDFDKTRLQQLPGLKIVSLRDELLKKGRAYAETIVLNWYEGDPADPVHPDDVAKKFDWRSQGLLDIQRQILDRLRGYSGPIDYRVQWLPKPDLPSFTVRVNGIECFKVGANGTIAFPCSRWPVPPDRKTAVLETLADTLKNNWFKGREMKKKGGDVRYILRSPDAVDPLIATLSQLKAAT